MLVDSHVNLHGEKFVDDLDEVIARAHMANVKVMVNICCNIKDFDAVLSVAENYDNIYATIGTHPHDAQDNPDIKAETLIDLAKHPKVIGIGETGLDFHYNYSPKADQYANFQAHIEAARQTGLPLIIHTREADAEMQNLLEKELAKGAFPALLHCYSSGARLAEWAAQAGLYFALSGIITFKNAHELREIAAKLPDERIMLETDCPYLAPVPYRGRRNEPSYLPKVAEELARIKNWSIEETKKRTTQAFFALFSKAKRVRESI